MLQKHKGLLDLCVCSRLYRCELTSKCRSLIALMCVFWGKEKRDISSTDFYFFLLLLLQVISTVHLISLVYVHSLF